MDAEREDHYNKNLLECTNIFSILFIEYHRETHLQTFETLVDHILHNNSEVQRWANRAMNPDIRFLPESFILVTLITQWKICPGNLVESRICKLPSC